MPVPRYGATLVNGARRSSCSGPRLLTGTPTTEDPDDHAPSNGWCAVRTSRERTVKYAASPTGIQCRSPARTTATTNGVSATASATHSTGATGRRPARLRP